MKNDGLLPGLVRLGVTVEAHVGRTTEPTAAEDAQQVAQELNGVGERNLLLLFEVIVSVITKSPTAMRVSAPLLIVAEIDPPTVPCRFRAYTDAAGQPVGQGDVFFVSNPPCITSLM
jgi:hypothetical protein